MIWKKNIKTKTIYFIFYRRFTNVTGACSILLSRSALMRNACTIIITIIQILKTANNKFYFNSFFSVKHFKYFTFSFVFFFCSFPIIHFIVVYCQIVCYVCFFKHLFKLFLSFMYIVLSIGLQVQVSMDKWIWLVTTTTTTPAIEQLGAKLALIWGYELQYRVAIF